MTIIVQVAMKRINFLSNKISGKRSYLCVLFIFMMLLSLCCTSIVSASTKAEPDLVSLNKKVSGVLTKDNLQFFYIKTDNKDVNYDFVLKNNASSESSNFSVLKIRITVAQFHSNGEYQYDDFLINDWVDPTKSRTLKKTLKLKKNTKYIIELCPFYYEDTPFTLTVNQTPKIPSVKKIEGKKAKISVQLSKVSSANGYEIAVKKKGGIWKTYKTKKNSYTIKKLSSKKIYSVKVRSVYKINNQKHYSAWSSVSKVKTQ